ncbi:MAG: PTS sugar transporter subunit IIA [bacterium]
MVGIVIASHHTLALALKETLEMIIGITDNVAALSLEKTETIEAFAERLKALVKEKETGEGVIIFTDMFGGTPCNAALLSFEKDEKVKVLAGFNLPILIEAAMHASKNIDDLFRTLMEKRDKTIIDAKAIFSKRG